MSGRILIVDDVATNRIVLKVKLASAHYVPLMAASGAECLRVARREVPDLILLDLNLPDMSGFDLLGQVRKTAWGAAMPVIAVSADQVQPTIDKAYASGVADFVPKPIDLNRLEKILSRYTSRGN